ncbi:MAG: DUF5683 domain-containing protein, partial [Chitinivibrionales bacterium]
MEKKSQLIELTILFISLFMFPVSADTTDSDDLVNKETSLSDSSTDTATQNGSILEEEEESGKLITDEEEESFFQVQEEPEELEDTETDEEPAQTVDDEPREELKKRDSQREKEMMNKGQRLRADENKDKQQEEGEEEFKPSDKIERDASINFAKSVEDYKSPKKAFFMSLMLPGLGQAYTKNITKSILFGLAEVGMIAAYFGVEKNADNREESAQSYARNHFIADSLINYYYNLQNFINNTDTIGISQGELNSIFSIGDSTENIEDYVKPGSNDFYSIIKNPAYVQGWEDAEPNFTETGYSGDLDEYDIHSDSSWLIKRGDEEEFNYYGFSDYQDKYKQRIGNASNLHDIAKVFLYILIANHVGSSIDAFISAKIYNRRLLKEQSENQAGRTLWENLDIKNKVVFRENGPEAEMELV